MTQPASSTTDCTEPNLSQKLAGSGFAQLLVRRDTAAGQWFVKRPAPAGLRVAANFEDGIVFAVTEASPEIYTAATTGFFPREHDAEWSWQWMGDEATWTIVNTSARPIVAAVSLEVSAFHRARRMELALDGRPAQAVVVEPSAPRLRDWSLDHPLRQPPAGISSRRIADRCSRGHQERRSALALVCRWHLELECAERATMTTAYRDFWAGVGERFPDLAGAASTRYYSDNERRLFTEHFPPLDGLKILKTDLWDEAKNTRILAWASRQGARAYGVDISPPIVVQARAAFDAETRGQPLRDSVGDVRDLPFRTASFDAIYSMGTIEHFDETERAVEEIARVLKPGGRAIIGVPNRHDPFLRPLFVTVLQAIGLYGYGYEKSYSRRALKKMLEARRSQRRRRDRDPLHPRLAANARPCVPHLVPPACRAHRCARAPLRHARPLRAGRAASRLPACHRRHKAGTRLRPDARRCTTGMCALSHSSSMCTTIQTPRMARLYELIYAVTVNWNHEARRAPAPNPPCMKRNVSGSWPRTRERNASASERPVRPRGAR